MDQLFLLRTYLALMTLILLSTCGRSLQSDLGPLLFQAGDAPTEVERLVVNDHVPQSPGERQWKQILLTKENGSFGGVTLAVFDTTAKSRERFDGWTLIESQEGVDDFQDVDVGDDAAVVVFGGTKSLVFRRCQAVAIIEVSTLGEVVLSQSDMQNYAQRLDERIKPHVC